MAKPTTLDEYFEKMLVARDQIKTFKNNFVQEDEEGKPVGDAADLYSVTLANLKAVGLTDEQAAYEYGRLVAMKGVYDALKAFDNASS